MKRKIANNDGAMPAGILRRHERLQSFSCLQSLNDPCTNFLMAGAGAINGNVRILPVQGGPFREKVVYVLVRSFCQTPGSIISNAQLH